MVRFIDCTIHFATGSSSHRVVNRGERFSDRTAQRLSVPLAPVLAVSRPNSALIASKAANDHLVSVLDAGTNHGVALHGKYECGRFVSHQISVEVQLFFGVVSSRGWEPGAHPVREQPESIGRHILQQALWGLMERGCGSVGGVT